MSIRLTSSRLLKLAFFALLTPQFAFSSDKVEMLSQLDEESEKVVTAPAPQLSFERIP